MNRFLCCGSAFVALRAEEAVWRTDVLLKPAVVTVTWSSLWHFRSKELDESALCCF